MSSDRHPSGRLTTSGYFSCQTNHLFVKRIKILTDSSDPQQPGSKTPADNKTHTNRICGEIHILDICVIVSGICSIRQEYTEDTVWDCLLSALKTLWFIPPIWLAFLRHKMRIVQERPGNYVIKYSNTVKVNKDRVLVSKITKKQHKGLTIGTYFWQIAFAPLLYLALDKRVFLMHTWKFKSLLLCKKQTPKFNSLQWAVVTESMRQ